MVYEKLTRDNHSRWKVDIFQYFTDIVLDRPYSANCFQNHFFTSSMIIPNLSSIFLDNFCDRRIALFGSFICNVSLLSNLLQFT